MAIASDSTTLESPLGATGDAASRVPLAVFFFEIFLFLVLPFDFSFTITALGSPDSGAVLQNNKARSQKRAHSGKALFLALYF
jgi:hypothetical protein